MSSERRGSSPPDFEDGGDEPRRSLGERARLNQEGGPLFQIPLGRRHRRRVRPARASTCASATTSPRSSAPVQVGPLTAGNRLCVQPMEGCDGTLDGTPDELTYRRYRRFGAGGAKLIWGEAAAVVDEGRANPRQLLVDRGQRSPDLARMLARLPHGPPRRVRRTTTWSSACS